jgi:PAS domain S-box-containing protein
MDAEKMETQSTKFTYSAARLVRYTLILTMIWTVIIVVSCVWSTQQRKKTTIALATKEAQSHFNKDVSIRLWATTHGGVYVPTDERTPPNPHLKHLNERDITTPSGKKLTLMNPAYMLRQMMAEYSELYGIKGRIISLKPFRPQNAPDDWERSALTAFEKGVKEVFEFVDINDEPYLRLIHPMITEKGCLKCHGSQDYKVGDIRGGVGVSVPMSPYLIHERREIRQLVIPHILVLLIGIVGIYFGFLGSKRYFAERKQSDENLLKQTNFLQKAQEIGQIGTWELDIETNELTWTDEMYRIFELPIGTEITYESFLNCVHPDDREYVDTEWKASFYGKPYDIEHRLLVDGQVKWVREKAELKFNEKNECIKGIGFTQDITELKGSEAARYRLEQDYYTLFHEMFDGFALHEIICDAQGKPIDYRFLTANPAFERMTGLKTKNITGKTVLEILPETEQYWIDIYGRVVLTGEPASFEHFAKEFGKHFEVLAFKPSPNQFACIFTDITKRKKLESRLRQAQKMESIGTLAGGIAHDFNNILFPLTGYAEILKEEVPSDSLLRGHIDKILHAALRARNLVKQILTFSRQGDLELKLMKLQPVVKEALKLIRSSIPTTIEIKEDIDPGCGVVVADPTQIHQIVMNLATNAYHAMENTGGRLKVTLKQVGLESDQSFFQDLASGEYALLTVSDTGIGIEKDALDKIFDPYFTTKEKGKGTGLGLSVVQGIVKSFNGDIRIYSEPGKGTEIHVYLPIIDQKVDDILTDRTEPVSGGTERILLVDDEEVIVRMEQQMLERIGYQVTISTGSVDALEAFKANPDSFDLIVTDMTMPNMTGDRLAVELVKIRSDIPIIICSGFSDQMNEEKAAALGLKGFLTKPVLAKAFARKIREVLDSE